MQTRAKSTPSTKWNELEILSLKIYLIIQESLRIELFWILPSLKISMYGPSINIKYCLGWTIGEILKVSLITALRYGSFWMSSSSRKSLLGYKFLISDWTLFITFGFFIRKVIAQTVVAALVSVPAKSMFYKIYRK